MRHFAAVLRLRLLLARREFLSIFSGVVFPFIMVAFAVAIAAAIPATRYPSTTTRVALFDLAGLTSRPPSSDKLNLGLVISNPVWDSTPLLAGKIMNDIGQNRLTIDRFTSTSDFAAADTLNLMDASKPYYPGGVYINSTLASFVPQDSTSKQDFGYTILLEGSQKSAGTPLLSSYVSSLANAFAGSSTLPAPTIIPKTATFVTGEVIDIGAQIVPSFLVNALTFSVLNVAEARVKENEKGVISQLYLSGIDTRSFFFATAVSDGMVYLWAVTSSLFFLYAIGYPTGLLFVTQPSPLGYIIPMLVYGLVVLPFGYCISFCFKKPTSVGTVGASIQTLVVFVPYFVVQFVLHTITREWALAFSALVPSFGLYRILDAHATSVQSGSPFTASDVFSFSHEILPILLVFLGQSVFFSLLAIFLFHLQRNNITVYEYMSRKKVSSMKTKAISDNSDLEAEIADDTSFPVDQELQSERDLLKNQTVFDDSRFQMTVEGVNKIVNANADGTTRKNLVILNDLWFSVRKGECFGFLGPNGAGKSTTIKILTGLDTLTSGRVRFSSDLEDELTATHIPRFVHSQVGYCPQHDALWPKLTSREHLEFYAAIRGIEDVGSAAMDALDMVGIKKGDVKSETLSGGNKRRLMLAIATIGSPKLIFLDEPTTGVDIAIRRTIWKAIEECKKQSAVILTSHSMEEVDALADRIGILVNGKLRCLGSSQTLKSTHGSGYVITLRTKTVADVGAVVTWFAEQLNSLSYSTRCTRAIGCTIVFEVSSSDHSVKHSVGLLETVFGVLKDKEERGIHDFSVSQTTLQQVFVEFSKRQKELKTF